MPWISQKMFAERVGCTTANVTIGIRRGRISPEWVKREGSRSVLINTEAVADWLATTRTRKTEAKKPASPPLPQSEAPSTPAPWPPLPPATIQRQPDESTGDMPLLLWGQPPADGNTEKLEAELEQSQAAAAEAGQPRHESERRSAELRARLLEIDLAREEQALMDARAIKKAWFEAGRQILQRLMGLPVRLASDLAAMNDAAEIAILLEREMTTALERLNDEMPC
ncbi:hypothetical protein [Synechococcus sp. CS-205]|uniref:hypothetical protein n=1 Tax=Synechococcus sp. CS-205 TaxID=2847984 RepID=UPI00223AE246|nr:hypothetical protein [Synechococcus sp. CS-205]MCT0247666.1 hypothetical protein [Synechococcus sp. CS-205]